MVATGPSVVRAATGKLVYAKRLDHITSTWASPIVDPQERIFFATAATSYVIQSGPEFRVLAVNELPDPSIHPRFHKEGCFWRESKAFSVSFSVSERPRADNVAPADAMPSCSVLSPRSSPT